MQNPHFYSEHLFIPALLLSVTVHVILIGASGWLPSGPQFSVIESPSSLEVTVINRPVVTVVEKEIVSEEIITVEMITQDFVEDETSAQMTFNDQVKKTAKPKSFQPSVVSQKIQGAVTKAKPLMHVNPAPPYPRAARQRGWEGTVRLSVSVDQDGIAGPVAVQRSSGHKILDEAAIKTVGTWKFSPARSGALRFSSKITIPIQFTLVEQ